MGEIDPLRTHVKPLRSPQMNHRSPPRISPGRLGSPSRPSARLEFKRQEEQGEPCRRCIVKNLISEVTMHERSLSKHSRVIREEQLKKSRSKSSHHRESMTSLEKLRRTSELRKHNNESRLKSPEPNASHSKRKQNQTVSIDNPCQERQPDHGKRQKKEKGREMQKKCAELIRKRLELEQRQKERLRATIKIQAVWRGFLVRKRMMREYEKMLEEQEEFLEQRHSIIDGIKESTHSNRKSKHQSEMQQGLEDIIQLKEQLRRQMDDIGSLKDRLERKDRERQQYYTKYIEQLKEQYSKGDSSKKGDRQNAANTQLRIEDNDPEEDQSQRRDRVKIKVKRMLQAIIDQRVLHQLTEEQEHPKEGYCLNLGSIRGYLSKLSNWICAKYHKQCQLNINKRFGFSFRRRLSLLHEDLQEESVNSYSEEILHFVVAENIFQQLEEEKPSEGEDRHFRKAIFDALNQGLTVLRPYYRQSSEPYPWSVMNFSHKERRLEEALNTIQTSIIGSAKSLCGLIVALDSDIQNQLALRNRQWKIDVFEKREEQATQALLHQWISDSPDWQYREDQKTQIRIELSDWLLEQLVGQFTSWAVRTQRVRHLTL